MTHGSDGVEGIAAMHRAERRYGKRSALSSLPALGDHLAPVARCWVDLSWLPDGARPADVLAWCDAQGEHDQRRRRWFMSCILAMGAERAAVSNEQRAEEMKKHGHS